MPRRKRAKSYVKAEPNSVTNAVRKSSKRERELDAAASRGYTEGYNEAARREAASLDAKKIRAEFVKQLTETLKANSQLVGAMAQALDSLPGVING